MQSQLRSQGKAGIPLLVWQGETRMVDAHTTLVEGFTSSSRLSHKASLPVSRPGINGFDYKAPSR